MAGAGWLWLLVPCMLGEVLSGLVCVFLLSFFETPESAELCSTRSEITYDVNSRFFGFLSLARSSYNMQRYPLLSHSFFLTLDRGFSY